MSSSNIKSTSANYRDSSLPVMPYFVIGMVVGCTVTYVMTALGFADPLTYKLSIWPFQVGHYLHGSILLVTHILMHSNFDHLFINMLFLVIVGTGVERALGSARMAGVYFGGAIIAGLWFLFITSGSETPAFANGASAAVAAVMGAALIVSRNALILEVPSIRFKLKANAYLLPGFCIRAWLIVVATILNNLAGMFFHSSEPALVAQSRTHLVGLAVGIVITCLFKCFNGAGEEPL